MNLLWESNTYSVDVLESFREEYFCFIDLVKVQFLSKWFQDNIFGCHTYLHNNRLGNDSLLREPLPSHNLANYFQVCSEWEAAALYLMPACRISSHLIFDPFLR